jgi:hypothetical protein
MPRRFSHVSGAGGVHSEPHGSKIYSTGILVIGLTRHGLLQNSIFTAKSSQQRS